MTFRVRALLAALGALCMLTPVSAQQAPVIRVATPPIDAGAQPFYARDMGFFKKAGINVEVVTVPNGAAIAAAVASGAADIGQGNLVSLALAHERGIPIVMFAGSNLFVASQHQNAIVVAPDSPLKNARDLSGKVVAVNGLKSITEVGADAWVDRNGGNYPSVKYIDMPFATMVDAVEHGRVDAAVLAEPQLDDALAKHRVRVLAYPYEAIAKEFLLAGWFANADWYKTHTDAARAYRSAMQMAGEWANKNQAESAKILEQAIGTTVTSGGRVIYATKLDPKLIQPLIDAAAKYGALRTAFPAADFAAGS